MHIIATLSRAALALLLMSLPAANAQEVTLLRDAQQRFSVPVPVNWIGTTSDHGVILSDPDGLILVHAVALPASDLEEAIAEAWKLVDPSFTLAPATMQDVPAEAGVERALQADYNAPNTIFHVSAKLYSDTAYVLLFVADPAGVQRRSSQLQIIETGFRITELADKSLAGTTPARITPEIVAELEQFIAGAMGAFGVPGVAIAIVQDGQIAYSAGVGVTQAGGDVPVTSDTQMMIGSAGKSLTTLLMGALVDAGRLRWDAPVVEIMPQFSVADSALTPTISARDLVCACSGVPRRDPEILFNAEELTGEDIVASLTGFEFFTPFGEAFQYSNQLVAAGGYLAAMADGAVWGELQQGFEASLRIRLLEPLGMSQTTPSFAQVIASGNYAHPHIFTLENRFQPAPLAMERVVVPVAPAGGLWSTANDMARYLLLELARGTSTEGTRVVSPENLQIRWEPQVPATAQQSYGLGWFVDNYMGLRLIHHSGNTFGFTSELAFLPDAATGIVVLSNARGATFLTREVRTRLFELLFDQPEQARARAEFLWKESVLRNEQLRQSLAPIPEDLAMEFEGVYANAALGEVNVSSRPGGLLLEVGVFDIPMLALREDAGSYIGVSTPAPGYVSAQFRQGLAGAQMILTAGGRQYEFNRG